MENTIWSLIPPILAIIMVLTTRRVIISLTVGIVSAAFFISQFNVIDSFILIVKAFSRVILESDGSLNTWNIYIILFLILLGVLTSFVSMMGGTRAFGDWMIRRVKTRIGAQLMTLVLGMIIFVDDYFNSLTVGPISRPVTDKHRVSRAKLAYLVDSTSAPISVIAPVSSWGAYIIGIIGSVLVAQNVTTYTALEAFIQMIPMNFYVWSALGVIIVIVLSKVDFGPMKKHEDRAMQTGRLMSERSKQNKDLTSPMIESDLGRVSDLLIPIGTLFIGTLVAIYINGFLTIATTDIDKTLINIFGEADVSAALLIGGIIGLFSSFLLFIRHFKASKLLKKDFGIGIVEGAKSMIPAINILIFAWTISFLIDEIGTGEFIASIVKNANLNLALLPMIVFIMAGFIAFSTGTSWGSFAILLPIAGQIASATDIELLLPVLAAVLAGAVFGDHCSPISDTTILSSTGANCHHIDHVMTQLPYALVAALISIVGYIILGITSNVWIGLCAVVLSLLILYIILTKVLQTSNS